MALVKDPWLVLEPQLRADSVSKLVPLAGEKWIVIGCCLSSFCRPDSAERLGGIIVGDTGRASWVAGNARKATTARYCSAPRCVFAPMFYS